MDAKSIQMMIQQKYKGGDASNTNFNAFLLSAIGRAMDSITSNNDYWFLRAEGTINTVINQFRYKIGSPAPATPLVSAEGVAGTPSGKYEYMVTFVNSFGESNPSSRSIPITVASKKVSLTAIPLGESVNTVTSRKIYRTKDLNTAANDNTFFLLGTLANNTATTLTDNSADSILGARLEYQDEVKMTQFAYQVSDPAYIKKVQWSTFRKLRLVDTADTGNPKFGMALNDDLYLYPLADAAIPITYPYFKRFKKVEYPETDLPDAIPHALIFDYVESETVMFLNMENKFYNQAIKKYSFGLGQLDNIHIKNKPAIKVISEDEAVANFVTEFPIQTYYDNG